MCSMTHVRLCAVDNCLNNNVYVVITKFLI